jgi:hypothetical protein
MSPFIAVKLFEIKGARLAFFTPPDGRWGGAWCVEVSANDKGGGR